MTNLEEIRAEIRDEEFEMLVYHRFVRLGRKGMRFYEQWQLAVIERFLQRKQVGYRVTENKVERI